MRAMVWFRRDLRVADNRALSAAAHDADQLVAVYFVTPAQWKSHNDAPAKISFWLKNVQCLKIELQRLNIPLLIFEVADFSLVPSIIEEKCRQLKCTGLYFNQEYEVNEAARDSSVIALLKNAEITCKTFHDRILIEPGAVLTGQGKPYTVFTPFRNNWAKKIVETDTSILPVPKPAEKISDLECCGHEILNDYIETFSEDFWPVGEKAAQKRLAEFCGQKLAAYSQTRDLPALDGTSRLSGYLTAGVLSPRQCFSALNQANNASDKLPDFTSSAGVWLNELIWRDFYHHVMVAFPRVGKGYPFQLATERISWLYDKKHLLAWQNGLTGYPIVDAAMRQLKQTGWMHNRLRMVAAMFLSKHLLHDWRFGERWFMQNLVDGELASNNGGWQWSASTGTDAAPYFRVFNPFSQSKKFDKDGVFIRQYCPELENIPAKALHDPMLLQAEVKKRGLGYPAPLVEHAFARNRAIEAFRK